MDGAEYPKSLQSIIAALGRLPGIGKRSAERITLALLDWPDEKLAELARRIACLKQEVKTCRQCGNFADDQLCRVCANPRRDHDRICVVEDAPQIAVIERAGCYRGLYHVLGGRIEPLEGKSPDDLSIESLMRRVNDGHVAELIIATSSDVEGEATAAYIAETFASQGIPITRIAAGVPVGADLSYADSATIAMAMSKRSPLRHGEP